MIYHNYTKKKTVFDVFSLITMNDQEEGVVKGSFKRVNHS